MKVGTLLVPTIVESIATAVEVVVLFKVCFLFFGDILVVILLFMQIIWETLDLFLQATSFYST